MRFMGVKRGRRRFWGLLVVRLDLGSFPHPFSVSSSNLLYESHIQGSKKMGRGQITANFLRKVRTTGKTKIFRF